MKRSDYWDNIKGILMLLTVIAHFMSGSVRSSCSIYQGIYLFHMPLFIFVSGMFHKNKDIKERVLGLILIGVLYNIFLILIDNVILQINQEFYVFRATKIPWFVFTLAMCTLITYCVRDCGCGLVLIISVIIALAACYDGKLMEFISIAKTVSWFPFYYMGFILDREYVEKIAARKSVRLFGRVIALGYVTAMLFGIDWPINIAAASFLYGGTAAYPSMSLLWMPVKAVYYCCVILVSMALMSLTPAEHVPVLTKIGKSTMQIYFWHIPVRSVFFATGLQNKLCGSVAGAMIYTLMTAVLTYLLTIKIFKFPTAFVYKYLRRNAK